MGGAQINSGLKGLVMKKPRLLGPTAKDWQLNASLNWIPDSHDALDMYAEGYLEAAKLVSRAAVKKGSKLTIDAVLWPMVFLWRHYLELRLKELIVSAADLSGGRTPRVMTHDLGMLWRTAKELLTKTVTISAAELRVADAVFSEFASSDALSEAFRYPTDKKGQRLAMSRSQINLRRVKITMEALSRILEDVSIEISVLRDYP